MEMEMDEYEHDNEHENNEQIQSTVVDTKFQSVETPIITPGHISTIRDLLWFDDSIVSGGEDSRLCIWSNNIKLIQQSQQCQQKQKCKSPPHTINETNSRQKFKNGPY
jgi:hypothetical protein